MFVHLNAGFSLNVNASSTENNSCPQTIKPTSRRLRSSAKQLRFSPKNNCEGERQACFIEARVKEIRDTDFEAEVLKSDTPVLVDFYRPLCGPCKLVSPLMDWADAQYSGKLKVVKINAEIDTENASAYEVRGLPSLLVFASGQLLQKHQGVLPKPALQKMVESSVPSLVKSK
mmetsp:Transcript_5972/g.10243  ORF Transcript_5972/g.10243 Transcript_5972/m.10243 type:complete len:173 (+) Transcript_5972:147-665(+)